MVTPMPMTTHSPLTFFASMGRCAFICCLLCGTALLAQPAVEKKPITNAASIRFEQTTHDLGRIAAGSLVKREIVFTNEGDADLTIRDISHTCSCTTTPEWTRVTPPKGKGRIILEFQAMAMSGEMQKTIAVHSNDPAKPVIAIALKGMVWQPLEITPGVAVMKTTALPSQELSTVVRIINHTDQPISLKEPASDNNHFLPRLETITAGKEFRLTVSTKPPFPAGMLSANITIATSSAERPVLTIPAVILHMPELVVHPPQLFLSAHTADAPHLISIRSQSPQPVAITHVSCDAPGSRVTIREITAGKDFELSVQLPKDLGSSPPKTYTITAKTTASGQPTISIPISFARAPAFPPPSP